MSRGHPIIDIPQAASMRADGLSYGKIGKAFGVSSPAVYYALNPERKPFWRPPATPERREYRRKRALLRHGSTRNRTDQLPLLAGGGWIDLPSLTDNPRAYGAFARTMSSLEKQGFIKSRPSPVGWLREYRLTDLGKEWLTVGEA